MEAKENLFKVCLSPHLKSSNMKQGEKASWKLNLQTIFPHNENEKIFKDAWFQIKSNQNQGTCHKRCMI